MLNLSTEINIILKFERCVLQLFLKINEKKFGVGGKTEKKNTNNILFPDQ